MVTAGRLAAMLLLLSLALAVVVPVAAQEPCRSRGTLDPAYCDEDGDLVADPPRDPRRWRSPGTLVFTYAPVEDPAIYEELFRPFMDHLARATGRRVVYYQVHSYAAQVEAMRSGRLHIGAFATGATGFAVNLAGAVPFAQRGSAEGPAGYAVIVLVRRDSPYQKLTDLKGKKLAHATPSSHSGNIAPRVLFPPLGLTPDTDYKVVYSGGHDKTVFGVNSGDYDAGTVASTVFERMVNRGTVKGDAFRVIYRSDLFPTAAFAHAHDLHPELAGKIRQAFEAYRYPPELRKAFEGSDRFLPASYKKDWHVVRLIAEQAEGGYTRGGLDEMARREEAEAKKRADEAARKKR